MVALEIAGSREEDVLAVKIVQDHLGPPQGHTALLLNVVQQLGLSWCWHAIQHLALRVVDVAVHIRFAVRADPRVHRAKHLG